MARFIINVKELALKDGVEKFRLDDVFFKDFDSDDIVGGDVEVSFSVAKSQNAKYDYMVCCKANGTLRLPCTRCLDEMDFEVGADDNVKVVCSNQTVECDDEDTLQARADGTLDLSHRIFETLALEIPSVHVHPEGECNPAMVKWLEEHSGEMQ